MTKHTCERCLNEFSSKSKYNNHLNKKKQCKENTVVNNETNDVETSANEQLVVPAPVVVEAINTEALETMDTEEPSIKIYNTEGLKYLSEIDKNSIDLILTDPPYIISKRQRNE